MIVQLLFHMYFIVREEDTILERWKVGLISSSSKTPGEKEKNGAGCEDLRCYMAQLCGGVEWVTVAGW